MTSSHSLNDELHREVALGERVEWSGRPLPGVRFRPSDALFIPFSLMWGGFAFFWEFSVWNTKAPFFFRLWGIPFVLVGMYVIAGRFFFDAAMRRRTIYAITDRRAIIISGFINRSVRSIDLAATPELGFTESSGGLGTIMFGSMGAWASAGRGTRTRPPQFEMLENGRAVYEKVRTVQQTVRRSA